MTFKNLLRFLLQTITVGLVAAIAIYFLFPSLLPGGDRIQISESGSNVTVTAAQQPATEPFSYANAVVIASPAVVNIHTARVVTQARNPLISRLFGNLLGVPRQRLETSLGSGVIVSKQGHLLTNHHVVDGADKIQVLLKDGRKTSATIVGTDEDSDLTVLKIDLPDLPAITLGHSDKLRVGDVVLAIGNPFGVGQTVTMGIISATGRSGLGINIYEDFIQTDAAINPGNSGGALINPYGHLIGINSAIFSKSGGSEGIGFAIPVGLVKDVMLQIIRYGHVIKGWLGIELQHLTPALAESFGMDNTDGILIAGVYRKGPAGIAGIEPGDILLTIDDKPALDPSKTLRIISFMKPGEKLTLEILRSNKVYSVELSVAKRPEYVE
jgi:serine protease DegS